jgi:recombination protein RecT
MMSNKVTEVKAIMAKAKKPNTFSGLKQTDVGKVLSLRSAEISQALPKHITPERVIQMASTVISANPRLAECNIGSIVGSIVEASVLGFKPSNALGQCYFVPYGGNCQFQIGYRGWIELVRRSGQLKTIYAHVVREGDEFSYNLGLHQDIQHKPAGSTSAAITHAYAVAHFKDGGYQFEVLSFEEIEALRKRNRAQSAKPSGAWATDYAEMAKAKAVKRLAKYLPVSDEVFKAMTTDEAVLSDEQLSTDGTGVNAEAVSAEWEEVSEESAKSE